MDPRGFTVGRYPVHAVLGAGGFGTVYLGTDPGTGRPVAVKVLDRAAADPVQRGQLRAEADAMRRVNDPHCVRVLDVIDEAARAAIVTEFIEGASLRAVLDRAGRLTGPQALVVLRGALRGLVAVHAAGLIHGDLKPDNILVDQHGVSKLIDFGLAAAPQAPSQVRDSVVGSPSYLSPEQIRGAPADVRTDIYACAVMLFELLCGRRPYHADSVPAVLARHLNAPVPDPRSIVPDIGEALADLCRAGLAKDPAARPPTALAFLRALEDAARQRYGAAWAAGGAIGALMGGGFAVGAQQLAAKPVPAFGPARIARLVRPAHRGTRLALAGGTVAIVAGVVVAVTIVAGGHSSLQAAASPTPTPSPTTISSPSGGGPTEVNPGYTAYRNGRFMYSVEVPRILTEQPPPEDRSGQDWTDGRAVLTTFGENNVLHDTPASALTEKVHEVQQSGGRVSSRSSNGTSWTCSGVTASGAVFDEKQFVRSRAEYAISWTYPAADASRYQPLVQHTLAAFIPGPNRTG